VLGYGDILYGVGLTAVAEAVLALVVPRWRRPVLVVTAAAVGFLGPLVWQLVLRATHAGEFFADLPFRPFPVSWQDAGSGVAAFALGALVLAYGPMRRGTPGAVATTCTSTEVRDRRERRQIAPSDRRGSLRNGAGAPRG